LYRSDEAEFVIDIAEEEEPKSFLEVVNASIGYVCKDAVYKELDCIGRIRTYNVIDKAKGGTEVDSK
jgi:hypothetical protein